MVTKTKSEAVKVQAGMFNRLEAAEFAGVAVKTVDKAIEEKTVRARRPKRSRVVLDADDVMAIALIDRVGVSLGPAPKRRIRKWLRESRPHASRQGAEFALNDVLVIRVDSDFQDVAAHLERYASDRERYIETRQDVRGGDPVISGTRLSVRAVAERVSQGETIEDLIEDYPDIPREAFETALIYARTNPRRGRPPRPWADA